MTGQGVAITEAADLAESWVNGNRSSVVEAIVAMSPAEAAYVAVRVSECLDQWGERTHVFTERLFGAAKDGK